VRHRIAERSDAERLGGIVPGIDNDESQVACLDGCVVRSLADDQRVESASHRFPKRGAIGSGARANAVSARAPARLKRRRDHASAVNPRELVCTLHELRCRKVGGAADTNINRLKSGKPAHRNEAKLACQQHVVAELGVNVEWKVRGIHGNVVPDQISKSRMAMTGDRLHAAPEHPVMDEE
jgi:hypothetical protein